MNLRATVPVVTFMAAISDTVPGRLSQPRTRCGFTSSEARIRPICEALGQSDRFGQALGQ